MTTAELTAALTAASNRLAAARADADASVRVFRAAASAARDRRAESVAAAASAADAREAVAILTDLYDARQNAAVARVEAVVGLSLRAVFGRGMRFRLAASVKRGQPEMRPEVGYADDTGRAVWRTLDAVGGGVVDVTVFALRVALLTAALRTRRPVLLADEPFRHVSADRLPAVARLLSALSRRTGLQFVIVTHEAATSEIADLVVRVESGPAGSVAEPSPQ